MWRKRCFEDNKAFCGICCVLGLVGLILFAVMAYFFIQMIVSNIIPIAIAIVLVIAIPIVAKAYFQKTTGQPYDKQNKGGG